MTPYYRTDFPRGESETVNGRRRGDWSFRRWVRESRAYMAHLPWWQFYPLAVKKWFWFNRQQKADRRSAEASS